MIVARAYDTHIIKDPGLTTKPIRNCSVYRGDSVINMSFTDGALVAEVVSRGSRGSANSPYISGLSTDKLEAGSWYVFKMDIKEPNRVGLPSVPVWNTGFSLDGRLRYPEPKYWIDTDGLPFIIFSMSMLPNLVWKQEH